MLNQQFQEFVERWLQKAEAHNGAHLYCAFDKFYTLFVIYNKLYVEAFNSLPRKPNTRFRDSDASSRSVVKFVGGDNLWNALVADEDAKEAIQSLESVLAEGFFHISLDAATGEHKPENDRALLTQLRSINLAQKAMGLLQTLYHIRCNLFHGRKQFVDEQRAIIDPSNIILRKIVDVLYQKLVAA